MGPEASDPQLLDLYKLAVEMAVRVSARRATADASFLTVQAALVAVLGRTAPDLAETPWTSLAVALAGLVLSASSGGCSCAATMRSTAQGLLRTAPVLAPNR